MILSASWWQKMNDKDSCLLWLRRGFLLRASPYMIFSHLFSDLVAMSFCWFKMTGSLLPCAFFRPYARHDKGVILNP